MAVSPLLCMQLSSMDILLSEKADVDKTLVRFLSLSCNGASLSDGFTTGGGPSWKKHKTGYIINFFQHRQTGEQNT